MLYLRKHHRYQDFGVPGNQMNKIQFKHLKCVDLHKYMYLKKWYLPKNTHIRTITHISRK